MALLDIPTIGNRVMPSTHPVEKLNVVSEGPPPSSVNIEFVLVEDAGNPADDTTYGAVSYEYRISKYAIRETDIDDYNADSLNAGALQIILDERGDDKPATSVSWNEAARFVNWLNVSDGYQPAYKFDTGGANDPISLWDSADAWQVDGENLYRHKNTKYFLPSEDEWYKAAYYNGQANVYYDYPTGSDNPPAPTAGGTLSGTAVYNQSPPPADVTNAGGLSPYGTMGQGGNTYEWMESADDGDNSLATEQRVLRSGIWYLSPFYMLSSFRTVGAPGGENGGLGFRVASIIP